MLRILLMDEALARSPERSAGLRLALQELGHHIVAEIADPQMLWDGVKLHDPEAVIIEADELGRGLLEPLSLISASCPRPIVLFTRDARRESIHDAVRAGVSAYVVDGAAPERVGPILDAAIARFDALQAMRSELAQTPGKRTERKFVDRAKGILMQEKRLSEVETYPPLRKFAMDRSAPLGAVPEQVITYAKIPA